MSREMMETIRIDTSTLGEVNTSAAPDVARSNTRNQCFRTISREDRWRYDPEQERMMQDAGYTFEDEIETDNADGQDAKDAGRQVSSKSEQILKDAHGNPVSRERYETIKHQKWQLHDGSFVTGTGEPWKSKFEDLE